MTAAQVEEPLRARASRAAVGVALEVPALALAFQGGTAGLYGLALALLAVAGARTGGGAQLPVWIQAPLQAAFAGGLAVSLTLAGDMPRGQIGPLVTVGFLGAALPRLWLRVDAAGRAVTLGLGLLALMGLARALERPVFGLAVAAYLAAGLIAHRTADRSAPSLLRHPQAALLPLVATLSLAAALMAGLGWSLPAAEPVVSKALQQYLFDGKLAESGFGEGRVSLGDLAGIVSSDRVALRVFGDADHLRGMVYTDYAHGQWAARRRPDDRPPRGEGAAIRLGGPATGPPVRVEGTHDAGRPLFAPLAAAELLDAPEDARLDAYGIAVFPNRLLSDARAWRFSPGPPEGRRLAPPDDHDLALPRGLLEPLRALARDATGAAREPADRVAALARHLQQRYAYSLTLDPVPARIDPTWHFLTRSRRGHCEYFASALVLLARSQGVPARLVTGYRVFEFNPAGGYHIVRQRDAHAWAEVFVGGAWRTVDPTPAGVLEGESAREAGWWRGRLDLLRRGLGGLVERLGSLSPGELLAVTFVLAGLALGWIWVRRRRPHRPPPASFAPLAEIEARIAAARGPVREATEPLLRYAERLRAAGWPAAAALVTRCAHHRYGAVADPGLPEDARSWRPERAAELTPPGAGPGSPSPG